MPEFWGILVFDDQPSRIEQSLNEYGRNYYAIEITVPSDLNPNRYNNSGCYSAILTGITEMPVSRLSILK